MERAARRIAFLSALLACLLAPQARAQALSPTEAEWRAASRLGYGPTPALLEDMRRAGGAKAWALREVDAAYAASRAAPRIPAPMARFNQPLETTFEQFQRERAARKAGKADDEPPQKAAATAGGRLLDTGIFSRDMVRSAAAWRIASCSSPGVEDPLLARMTEFWFNHLNVFAGKGPVRPFVGHYEVNAIRANALGRFEDLLLASARHPAMLFYLDQAQSVAEGTQGPLGGARGLNENYARELMELHTLGVDGGYTQADVRELARILTGWTIGPRQPSGFRFAPRLHDAGEKRLLGVSFGDGGEQEGEDAIRMLARRPATARRIAARLAQFFVADQPPAALVDRVSRAFSTSRGDLRATLRALVDSPEFWDAGQRLFKTPYDYACSALAALGGPQEDQEILRTLGFLAQAGQPVHGWQTPDGYKTDAATWLSPEALTRRADFAVALGRRAPEPAFLDAYLAPATRERIAREPAALRTGLALASPEFMRK
jgi:uncharacterized protein (DUF1800 family)